MTFGRDDIPPRIGLTVGDSVDIVLMAQSGGGYRWAIGSVVGGVVEPEETRNSAGTGVGSGSSHTFRLHARKAGVQRVSFRYGRPWEQAPVDIFEVTVEVDPPADRSQPRL